MPHQYWEDTAASCMGVVSYTRIVPVPYNKAASKLQMDTTIPKQRRAIVIAHPACRRAGLRSDHKRTPPSATYTSDYERLEPRHILRSKICAYINERLARASHVVKTDAADAPHAPLRQWNGNPAAAATTVLSSLVVCVRNASERSAAMGHDSLRRTTTVVGCLW